jgi:hypothetical protein
MLGGTTKALGNYCSDYQQGCEGSGDPDHTTDVLRRTKTVMVKRSVHYVESGMTKSSNFFKGYMGIKVKS